MSVPEQTPLSTAIANGVTTVFAFPFLLLQSSDLTVKVVDTSGVPTVKVLGVDYSISGVGVTAGGTVTFFSAPANGYTVVMYRDSALSRATDYQNNGDFLAATVNADFDRIWLAVQELVAGSKNSLSAVRAPDGETVTPLPSAANRANLTLAFDASGNPSLVAPPSGTAADVLVTIAASGVQAANVRGGSAANSNLVLRSTSGAGTKNPATTTDTILFQRGNNGSQELGRFSPGGSFAVGDFTDGTSVNQHAGDDGTTTRVVAVRATTAPLFIGYTDRNNSESGGPVGRSVVSFEGYRLANTAGSREAGALRVITEGVSANQLGARVSILTRRDGYTDSDFLERWSVSNDGHVLHTGGSGGVASANRSGYSGGETVYTLSGKAGRAVIELATGQADADAAILGEISGIDNNNGTDKRVVILQAVQDGATAGNRGGALKVYCKPNGGSQAESFRFTSSGVKDAKPQGTLQAAPTLTISSNVITPTAPISFVGAGLIKTITVPANMTSHGGRITIIPTAAFTTDATGNIAIASTAVISRAMDFVYDGGTGKWYPSY